MSETNEMYNAVEPGSEELFTLTFTGPELISLNRSLNCWLAELQKKRLFAQPGDDLDLIINEAYTIAVHLRGRVNSILGIRWPHQT
jgi:hypothetical protein